MIEKGPTDLPAPLVPPDVDLTNLPYMPILIARLKQSRAWLICKRRPELAFYMFNLWTASWHARPAASLENDDDVLADLAMCQPQAWKKVKVDILRGWIECSDHRLYHPVVAEQALSVWGKKVAHHNKMEAARAAKEQRRLTGEVGQRTVPKANDSRISKPIIGSIIEPDKEPDIGSIIEPAIGDAIEPAIGPAKGLKCNVREGNIKEREDADLRIGTPAENVNPFGDPEPADVPSAADPPTGRSGIDPSAAKRDLYARGEAVMGAHSGGQVTKLLKAKGGNVALARAALETASTAHNPREYIAAASRGAPIGLPNGQLYDRGL